MQGLRVEKRWVKIDEPSGRLHLSLAHDPHFSMVYIGSDCTAGQYGTNLFVVAAAVVREERFNATGM